MKKTDELKASESDVLKAWYADSLSLLQPILLQSNASDLTDNSSKWQPCLEILLISTNGTELFSNSDSKICQSYIKSKTLKKISNIKILVEQFKGGLVITTSKKEIIRVIYFDYSSVMSILEETIPGVELSSSEFHLLMQILCGMSLKDASEKDNLSYETKRSQFKSLASRTGFKSQNEVIRNTLLALTTYALDLTSNFFANTPIYLDDAKQFFDIYYPKIFRFHQISTLKGNILRIAETGPITGKPVIWLHSQTLPSPDQFTSNWAEEKNIRFIIPLREGFLCEEEKQFTKHEHINRCTKEIAETIEFFCNSRASVIANSTGTAYALNLAANYPNHIEKMTICAAAYVGKYENNSIGRLVRGIKNLTLGNEILATKILDRYISKMSSLAGMKEVLKSTYEKSSYDMNIFNKLLASPLGHSWIYESYRMSRYSVIKDIAMGGDDIWQNAQKIKCKPLFIHGRLDPINCTIAARKAANLIPNSKFMELKNEGQSLFLNRLEDIVSNNL